MTNLDRHFCAFDVRKARTEFLHNHFKPILTPKVLDVGCYEAPLRALIGKENYHGIDIVGDPDQVVNLEECKKLPFGDNEFPTVICIEVLEHLDNLHAIFDDLFRVASKHVIVSLPNCWCGARNHVARGRGKIAHYGLPVERPVDRHKWFINVSDVVGFFEQKAKALDVEMTDLFTVEKPRSYPLRKVRELRYSRSAYLNRYSHTVFAAFDI